MAMVVSRPAELAMAVPKGQLAEVMEEVMAISKSAGVAIAVLRSARVASGGEDSEERSAGVAMAVLSSAGVLMAVSRPAGVAMAVLSADEGG